MSRALVFTDLDGSLLEHSTYCFKAALPTIERLRELSIPLIPVTSKSLAEVLQLRLKLHNQDPFIVENGAAVFIPEGYFPTQPAECTSRDGFWIREFAPPRSSFMTTLKSLHSEFPAQFTSFEEVGISGVAGMCNLSREDAALACQRSYSEPVNWHGNDEEQRKFIARLEDENLQVVQGGRFLSVSGGGNKGEAFFWLRNLYREVWQRGTIQDLAIGDSPNDLGMLEMATWALVILNSASQSALRLAVSERTNYSKEAGPHGWASGVNTWLEKIGHSKQEECEHG